MPFYDMLRNSKNPAFGHDCKTHFQLRKDIRIIESCNCPLPLVATVLTLLALVGCQGLPGKTPPVNPNGNLKSVDHVVFMLQENRTFDSYFGMLNPYRKANGWNVGDDGNTYDVDGIDDKLTRFTDDDDEGQSFSLFKLKSTCVDDMSSAWLESYGDVNRYDFSMTRAIQMNGFVHTAEGYAKSGVGDGQFTDLAGKRAMGYYDQTLLNYYYYMASQFAISDRWFSPVSSKSTPNRIATMTGGTTQGLVNDPFVDDGITAQLNIETIFEELDKNSVSWKIYYSVTEGGCVDDDGDCGSKSHSNSYPVTTFSDFLYSKQYLYENPQHNACVKPTIGSQKAVGDSSDGFCIDPTHIAPISQYFSDVKSNTLPSYAFIETAYGHSDEHPGSGQSILEGQQQVAKIVNALMQSPSWASSVFFLSYDEPGGPFDHVPPVPGHSNENTAASLGTIPDIKAIAVNADSFNPCLPPGGSATLHCDLAPADPGASAADAAAKKGFGAQLGFRLPNIVISPFARKHYVSHIPMDHTAVIKFVESRFIGSGAHLTNRDGAQPNLLDFFDFVNVPWSTPPTPPTPVAAPGPCTPQSM
jgi:phospholipase C